MEDISNGKLSTILLSAALVIFGLIATDPQYLQALLGDSLFLRWGGFILAVLLAFYNYYFPRLKKVVETGEEIKWDNGKLSTFAATAAMLFIGVFVADPTLLKQLLGDAAYAKFGALILAALVMVYNGKYPRNEQSQLTGSQDVSAEPAPPEIP